MFIIWILASWPLSLLWKLLYYLKEAKFKLKHIKNNNRGGSKNTYAFRGEVQKFLEKTLRIFWMASQDFAIITGFSSLKHKKVRGEYFITSSIIIIIFNNLIKIIPKESFLLTNCLPVRNLA